MKQPKERVILRDDDLSYFSNPAEIEKLYGSLWERVPISFAVIPKIYSHQIEAPQNVQHEKEYYSISENEELVSFLRKKISEGKVKILQHGYTHRNFGSQYELERSGVELLVKELSEGKRILEEAFQISVDTLVAPHDRFSRDAIRAVEQVGYTYLSRGCAPLPRELFWWDISSIKAFSVLVWYYLFHGRSVRYPKMMVFGRHTEIYNYRIEGKNKDSIASILLNTGPDGIIPITLHHRVFTVAQKEMVHYLLDQVEHTSSY